MSEPPTSNEDDTNKSLGKSKTDRSSTDSHHNYPFDVDRPDGKGGKSIG